MMRRFQRACHIYRTRLDTTCQETCEAVASAHHISSPVISPRYLRIAMSRHTLDVSLHQPDIVRCMASYDLARQASASPPEAVGFPKSAHDGPPVKSEEISLPWLQQNTDGGLQHIGPRCSKHSPQMKSTYPRTRNGGQNNGRMYQRFPSRNLLQLHC